MVYLVYRASTAGGQNFSSPTFTTARGALSYLDNALSAGSTFYYVVRAKDEAGNIDSNTVELMASTDVTSPTFAGATGATSSGSSSIAVSWNAATDNITPQSGIKYMIYRATTSGGQSYATATATTTAGALSYTDSRLTTGATYYYVVRAKDQTGNFDTNTIQASATTLLDTTAPNFVGATSVAAQSSSAIAIGWSVATDDITAQSNIVYLIYRSSTSGGQSYTTQTATTPLGVTSYTDSGLAAATNYYYVVRAKDEAGNVDTNTAQVTATTNASSSDTTAPTFAGASALTVQSGISLTLNWGSATDNVTSSANIVYQIYRATTSAGQNFAVPLATTSAGITSYADTSATGATKYYYVVRAKDQAGNRDTNTAEVSGPLSFLNDIYNPLIYGTCTTGCHALTANLSLNGSLNLGGANAYNNLVGVFAAQCSGGEKYVIAGNSSTSYLINKLTGTSMCSGVQMPKGGAALTTNQLNILKAWIDQGALNN